MKFGGATPHRRSQTVRYYGIYSNKSRGQTSPIPDRIIRPSQPKPPPKNPTPVQILLIPAPPKRRARDMRPLWRDLILRVWGGDPLVCPCCNGTMKVTGTMTRREEIEKRRRLVGVLDRNRAAGDVPRRGEGPWGGPESILPPPPRSLAGHYPSPAPATTPLRHRDHGAHRAALAGHQGMDPRRRTEPELVQPGKASMRLRARPVRPESGLEARSNPARRWPHPDLRRFLTPPEALPHNRRQKAWHDGKDDYALMS